jgi:cytochrome c
MKKQLLVSALFLILLYTHQLDTKSATPVPANAPTKTNAPTKNVELDPEAFVINVEEKRKDIVSLVKDGIDYLLKNRPEEAFYTFLNNRKFTKGEVTLFVFDTKGTVYVDEDESELWRNIKDYKNKHGINVLDLLVKKVEAGGGWVKYEWNNGFKSSYVERIEKAGVTYLVGAGWYPETKENTVESMVKSAVNYFYTHGKDDAFRVFSNVIGQFVDGDLYLYAYDAKGYCVAHGENVSLIGRDFYNLKDDEGKLLIQALIDKARQGGGWVHYLWNHSPKSGYVELVKDKDGEYIIGSGFHPENKRSTVVSLVKRGVKYFNSWGRERAAVEFNSQVGEFIFGDLALFMYTFKGDVLSQGDYLAYVGQNLYNLRSPAGEYIIKNLITKAESGNGWVDYQWSHDLASAYVEKVSDKEGNYLIGSAFYPGTKKEHVVQLVKSAIGYLRTHRKEEAVEAFSKRGGDFIQGSAFVFMFNLDGDCLVYGDNYSFVWKNFKSFQDMDGKNVFKMFLNKIASGGGWVQYTSKNITKLAYVQKVEKDNVPYIIGSAFYK